MANTMMPVYQALTVIHAQGCIHGSLSPQSVFVDDFGEIKLYFPGIPSQSPLYYTNQVPSRGDDFRALGLIALQLLRVDIAGSQLSSREHIKTAVKHRKMS